MFVPCFNKHMNCVHKKLGDVPMNMATTLSIILVKNFSKIITKSTRYILCSYVSCIALYVLKSTNHYTHHVFHWLVFAIVACVFSCFGLNYFCCCSLLFWNALNLGAFADQLRSVELGAALT
jgi:hypothetical protein